MIVLKQYVELLQHFHLDDDEFKLLFGSHSSKLYTFYELIQAEKVVTDEDAAHALYGKKPTFPAYRVLKSELKKKLIHATLILDFKNPQLNDIQQAYYVCQRNWVTINILGGRQKHHAVIDLAQATLEIAQRFGITETVVNTSRTLARQYHLYYPRRRVADRYTTIYQEAHTLLEIEYLAEKYYDDISQYFLIIRIQQKHLQEKAKHCLDVLLPYCDTYNSYRLHLSARLIHMGYYICVNNYTEANKVADAAIAFFRKQTFTFKAQLSIFMRQKMQCCMALKQYEEVEALVQASRDLNLEGSHGWYRQGITYIYLCMHTKQYQAAWESYKELIAHKNFKYQNEVTHEDVRLIEMYMNYMAKAHMLKLVRSDKKFLNIERVLDNIKKMPLLRQGKTGMSVPILIVQMLFILNEKAEGWEEDMKKMVSAFGYFKTRIIKEDDYAYRTNLFITLVNQIKRAQYKRSTTVKLTEKTLEILKGAPIHIHHEAYTSEVFPYDDTWAMMLGYLYR
jgi:tetratricopeptide (TPR) repeat protein